MPGQVATFYAAVVASLAGVAPSARGSEEENALTQPPRFVWTRKPSRSATPLAQGGKNPESFAAKWVNWEIRAWGRDDDDLEAMEAALWTAVKKHRSGARSKIEYGDFGDTGTMKEGVYEVFLLSVHFVIPKATLPTVAAAVGDRPSTSTNSATLPTVADVELVPDATTPEDLGDGVLTEDES